MYIAPKAPDTPKELLDSLPNISEGGGPGAITELWNPTTPPLAAAEVPTAAATESLCADRSDKSARAVGGSGVGEVGLRWSMRLHGLRDASGAHRHLAFVVRGPLRRRITLRLRAGSADRSNRPVELDQMRGNTSGDDGFIPEIAVSTGDSSGGGALLHHGFVDRGTISRVCECCQQHPTIKNL